MKDTVRKSCERLIRCRDQVRQVFPWDGGLIQLTCAGIYVMKDRNVDESLLEQSKRLLKEKLGIFSNFRGTARSPIAAMLAVTGNPERTLDNGIAVYERLKKEFWGSAYLPLAAMVIAQLAEPFAYEEVAGRTRRIYERMKTEHPFLTSGEDSAFCALSALSDRPDDELISDMEACYGLLKPEFFSGNAVQSLAHVLSLCEGTPKEKCGRTMELFGKLKEAGRKFGTEYELPALGIFAMTDVDSGQIVQEMLEIDSWLSEQKGFGMLGSINRKQRLMYAGMLAQKEHIQAGGLQLAADRTASAVGQTALDGTVPLAMQTTISAVSLVVAQEAAMCAAIAASTAAAAASSSSSS